MSDLFTSAFNHLVQILFFSGKAELLTSLAAVLGFMGLLFVVGKVPLSYNVPNLMGRWNPTAMTALPFTLVVSLTTRMLSLSNALCSAPATSRLSPPAYI